MSNKSNTQNTQRQNRKPFWAFLIDTDIRPLVLIGKIMKYFGTWIVVSFLLGVFLTYIYSQLPNAPFYNDLFPRLAKGEMEITGVVTDWDRRELENAIAYIAPLEYRQNIDHGNVKVKLPKDKYEVIVVTRQDPNKHGFAFVDENRSSFNIKMPPGEGKIVGRVKDEEGKLRARKIVCVSGGQLKSEICARTDSEGKYSFETIPAFPLGSGHLTIKVENTDAEKSIPKIDAYMVNNIEDIVIKVAEDPTVTGVLTDRNGSPIPNIWVSVDNRYRAITSYDGRFSIAVPTTGVHSIEVWWGNRQLYRREVNINTDPFNHSIRLP